MQRGSRGRNEENRKRKNDPGGVLGVFLLFFISQVVLVLVLVLLLEWNCLVPTPFLGGVGDDAL